jgi:very-short-patch-repair endonuclease
MKIYYNPSLKEKARMLRNNSTRSEIKLWNYIKQNKVNGYDFHRQKPIGNYIADFFCNKLMLVIELDGYSHSFEIVRQRDQVKETYLNSIGIHVLRFSDKQVMSDIQNVLRAITIYIEEYEQKHLPDAPC